MSSPPLVALSAFVDPTAIAIVAGGTLLATALRTPFADLTRGAAALGVLGRKRYRADEAITQVNALGRIAQRHGMLALDRSRIADPDIAAAVAVIIDGGEAAEVEQRLADRFRARADRHLAAAEMWAGAAEVAPAMGMVGTLVGLVRMFAAMTDTATIGAAMATALLATLYGAVLGNLALMPIATRLKRLARAEAIERLRLMVPLAEFATREAPRRLTAAPSVAA
ncbi:motility protein A [Sphingomonas sp. GlSt437]|uniref:motility protein A n=1 Tax=Sphingomonas sp. GlSt437 TaxID=3389970 RepID=UPI003A83B908